MLQPIKLLPILWTEIFLFAFCISSDAADVQATLSSVICQSEMSIVSDARSNFSMYLVSFLLRHNSTKAMSTRSGIARA